MAGNTHLLELCRSHRHLFIALDRDGTLVPYHSQPEQAIMPARTREVLNKLAQTPETTLAFVSARSVSLLQQDIDAKIILAGNYGMEILLANGQEIIAPAALRAAPELQRIAVLLETVMNHYPGCILDNHKYSLCLHWHLVADKDRDNLHQEINNIATRFDTTKVRTLPTSYEFLPNIDWNKGMALETISSHLPNSKAFYFWIYIGDSEQDEPAFNWVNSLNGYSLRVGLPKNQTCAKKCLARVSDTSQLLEQILDLYSGTKVSIESSTDMLIAREKEIEAVFAALKADYAIGLSERITELENIVHSASSKPDDLLCLEQACDQLHQMKGTIGSYGFKEISLLIGDIETTLKISNKLLSRKKT